VLDSDWAGRELREIQFSSDDDGLRIGRFKAHDWFADGSFYLLDTPGHTIGHMCGLARTSSNPDAFIFMGGDACHHGGEFRPTQYLPLPQSISPSPFASETDEARRALAMRAARSVCPGSLFQEVHHTKSATEPFYRPTAEISWDRELAQWVVDGMEEFDAQDNVLVGIAHDTEFIGNVPMFPDDLSNWQDTKCKEKVRWAFLKDFGEAIDRSQL